VSPRAGTLAARTRISAFNKIQFGDARVTGIRRSCGSQGGGRPPANNNSANSCGMTSGLVHRSADRANASRETEVSGLATSDYAARAGKKEGGREGEREGETRNYRGRAELDTARSALLSARDRSTRRAGGGGRKTIIAGMRIIIRALTNLSRAERGSVAQKGFKRGKAKVILLDNNNCPVLVVRCDAGAGIFFL
jgi:hypothetical protein